MTNAEVVDTGGPAFPHTVKQLSELGPGVIEVSRAGMSLRDYFAGQALATLSIVEIAKRLSLAEPNDILIRGCAAVAYEIADAMIARRRQ